MGGQLISENGIRISFEDNAEFPTGLNDDKSAVYHQENTITSFAPILGYSYSSPFTVNFVIRFSLEESSVMERVHLCRSLVVPDYDSGNYRPPSVTLTIEKYIEMFKGVVTDIKVGIGDDCVWVEGEPAYADVTFSIVECDTKMQLNVYGSSFNSSSSSSSPETMSI
jgi:hypothetical protein